MATIMVVDDEESVRMALRQVFERAGYVVVDASDGKAATRLVADRQVDLVITDILMPEHDGLELVSWLRKQLPNLKIIAISGGGRYTLTEFLKVAQLMGAHRTFVKPVSPRDLLTAVRELLGDSTT